MSLEKLFNEMLESFEEYNPGILEPFLEELVKVLGRKQLEPVIYELDRFDFDAAKQKIVKLAESLDIKVK